jgi:ubiquinol-cytochrome c reductase iron-sulfur subunit
MATYQAVKKYINLAPTVRVLPSGVPSAPRLNLAARAPSDGHGHGHGASGPRADVPARFTGSVANSAVGLVSKTFIGEVFFFYLPLLNTNADRNASFVNSTSPHHPFPSAPDSYFHCSERCS